MTNTERMKLLHALMRARLAFHESMRKSGYRISASDTQGHQSIYDANVLPHEVWPLAELTIKWDLREENRP